MFSAMVESCTKYGNPELSWVEIGMVEEVFAKEMTFDNEISVMKQKQNLSRNVSQSWNIWGLFWKIGYNISRGHMGEGLES